jgi:O-antigen/teichoic acid export membrane protein
MPTKIANIAKNTSYFTLALILQKAISLVYFTLYARALGPADLGKYYLAISFTTIFSIFTDLGLTNILTREAVRKSEDTGKLLGAVLALKFCLTAATLIILAVVAQLMGYQPLVRQLIYVSAISMLLDTFTTAFFACARAFHNLKYESISAVASQAVTLLVSLYLLSNHYGLVPLMFAQVASSAFAFAYSLFVLKKYWKLSVRPVWDKQIIWTMITLGLPFGIYALAQRFYTYFDSVLLFKIAGDAAAGLYQVPFKLINALQFLPMAFVASLYPALSHYWRDNREQLLITFERALNYSTIISLPITVGAICLADKIVILFKANFAAAALPLSITMLSLFFSFVNYPVGSLLNACDHQKTNTRNMIITTVASIVLNLILIPIFGVNGAALTVVLTTLLLFALGLGVSRQITPWRWRKVGPTFGKAFAASLIMAGLILFFKSNLSLLTLIILGALVYFACLFGLGGFKKADILSIKESFRTKS